MQRQDDRFVCCSQSSGRSSRRSILGLAKRTDGVASSCFDSGMSCCIVPPNSAVSPSLQWTIQSSAGIRNRGPSCRGCSKPSRRQPLRLLFGRQRPAVCCRESLLRIVATGGRIATRRQKDAQAGCRQLTLHAESLALLSLFPGMLWPGPNSRGHGAQIVHKTSRKLQ